MKPVQLLGAMCICAAAASSVGCEAHAQAVATGEVDSAPVVFVDRPTLVAVDGGVWVVRDYDYAVYYVDDNYWVYKENVWYRSRAYNSGWVKVEVAVVPVIIVSRDHHKYVHFHGEATAQTRLAPGGGSEEAEEHRQNVQHDERTEHREDAQRGQGAQHDEQGEHEREHKKDKDDKKHGDEKHEK